MNSKSLAEQNYDEIIARAAVAAAPSGFERRGSTLCSAREAGVVLINFQKSDKSSPDEIQFTINLGVILRRLSDDWPLPRAAVDRAHLRTRIGMLLPERRDKWWRVASDDDTHSLCVEISRVLVERGIPYLFEYCSEENLRRLWESGMSPGLTAVQRTRLLAMMDNLKIL